MKVRAFYVQEGDQVVFDNEIGSVVAKHEQDDGLVFFEVEFANHDATRRRIMKGLYSSDITVYSVKETSPDLAGAALRRLRVLTGEKECD